MLNVWLSVEMRLRCEISFRERLSPGQSDLLSGVTTVDDDI